MSNKIATSLLKIAAIGSLAAPVLATGTDYSSITSAVGVTTVAAAIVAMGALMVGPNVARWAVRKLAGFFR